MRRQAFTCENPTDFRLRFGHGDPPMPRSVPPKRVHATLVGSCPACAYCDRVLGTRRSLLGAQGGSDAR